jgi:uncharacterized membrane protein
MRPPLGHLGSPAAGEDRVLAFDLARGLAVVFMILIHVLRHWGEPSTWTTPVGLLLSFLGGPLAAPVFMVLMGASLAFSSRATFRSLAGRGIALLAMGYALNLARGTVPLALGEAAGVVTAEQVWPHTPVSLLTMVDILQLAGASLVVMAALRAVVRPGIVWLVLAVAVVLVAPALRGLTVGVPPVDALLGVLWATAGNVFYPVFPWAVFALVGAVLGERLRGASDRPRVVRRVGLGGVLLAAAGLALLVLERPDLDAQGYWALAPALVPGILGVVLAWIALCDLAVRRAPAGLLDVTYAWSSRVTAMYVIHWLVVAWGIGLVGYLALGLAEVLLAMVAVVVLTTVIAGARPVRMGRGAFRGAESAAQV